MIAIILAVFLGAAIVGGGIGGIETVIEAPAKFKEYSKYRWHNYLANKHKKAEVPAAAPSPEKKKKERWYKRLWHKLHKPKTIPPAVTEKLGNDLAKLQKEIAP